MLSIPTDDAATYWFHDLTSSVHVPAAASVDWHDRAAAQFLMQATFGPTQDTLSSLSSQTQTAETETGEFEHVLEDWIWNQVYNIDPALHREYYRRRANPRLDAVSTVGTVRGACEAKARWNQIAIRQDDVAQNISFSQVTSPVDGSVVTAMYIGGVLRSEVNLEDMRPFGLGILMTHHL